MNRPDRVLSLATPGATAAIIRRFGIHPRRRFGQHFLISQRVLDLIVESAAISAADSILEIGAGFGTLTMALAERAGMVTAVEVDEHLGPALQATVGDRANVRIIQSDILDLMEKGRSFSFEKVVANLPYNVATLVIMKLLESPVGVTRMVLTIQREVADRLAAAPGTRDYGALTVAVQYRAEVEIMGRVPATAFYPPPDVESAVVRIDVRAQPAVSVPSERAFFAVVRAAFGQRRKTLRNALTGMGIGPDEAAQACRAAAIDPRRRGETLSLEEFAVLSQQFRKTESHWRTESQAFPP